MKPITHAKLTYWCITVSYVPIALWLAAKSMYFSLKKNDAGIEKLWDKANELIKDRDYEVRRCYAYHKNGYELILKRRLNE